MDYKSKMSEEALGRLDKTIGSYLDSHRVIDLRELIGTCEENLGAENVGHDVVSGYVASRVMRSRRLAPYIRETTHADETGKTGTDVPEEPTVRASDKTEYIKKPEDVNPEEPQETVPDAEAPSGQDTDSPLVEKFIDYITKEGKNANHSDARSLLTFEEQMANNNFEIKSAYRKAEEEAVKLTLEYRLDKYFENNPGKTLTDAYATPAFESESMFDLLEVCEKIGADTRIKEPVKPEVIMLGSAAEGAEEPDAGSPVIHGLIDGIGNKVPAQKPAEETDVVVPSDVKQYLTIMAQIGKAPDVEFIDAICSEAGYSSDKSKAVRIKLAREELLESVEKGFWSWEKTHTVAEKYGVTDMEDEFSDECMGSPKGYADKPPKGGNVNIILTGDDTDEADTEVNSEPLGGIFDYDFDDTPDADEKNIVDLGWIGDIPDTDSDEPDTGPDELAGYAEELKARKAGGNWISKEHARKMFPGISADDLQGMADNIRYDEAKPYGVLVTFEGSHPRYFVPSLADYQSRWNLEPAGKDSGYGKPPIKISPSDRTDAPLPPINAAGMDDITPSVQPEAPAEKGKPTLDELLARADKRNEELRRRLDRPW